MVRIRDVSSADGLSHNSLIDMAYTNLCKCGHCQTTAHIYQDSKYRENSRVLEMRPFIHKTDRQERIYLYLLHFIFTVSMYMLRTFYPYVPLHLYVC